MGIAKMKFIDLTSDVKQLDSVLARFIDIRGFHPVLATEIVERVHGLTSFVAENPCQPMLQEIDEIEKKFVLNLPTVEQRDINYNINEMYEYIMETKEALEGELTKIKDAQQKIQKFENALISVKNIESLDIALDDLFACEYISIRFGRLPNDSVDKLSYFQNKPYVFKAFNFDDSYTWCMYFTTDEYKREVDNIFSSLFFERIFIPDFVHGTPKEAVFALEKEIENAQKEIDHY
ncbi:MAG: hypothetical protein V3569_03830, partial [Acholeplasmataceae bacterium]